MSKGWFGFSATAAPWLYIWWYIYMTCFQCSEAPWKYHFLPFLRLFQHLNVTFSVTAFHVCPSLLLPPTSIKFWLFYLCFLCLRILLNKLLLALNFLVQLTTKPDTKKSLHHYLAHALTVDWTCSLDFVLQEFKFECTPLLYKQQSEGVKNVHGSVIQRTKAALCWQALELKWQRAWIRVKDHWLVWRLFKPVVKRHTHGYTYK